MATRPNPLGAVLGDRARPLRADVEAAADGGGQQAAAAERAGASPPTPLVTHTKLTPSLLHFCSNILDLF